MWLPLLYVVFVFENHGTASNPSLPSSHPSPSHNQHHPYKLHNSEAGNLPPITWHSHNDSVSARFLLDDELFQIDADANSPCNELANEFCNIMNSVKSDIMCLSHVSVELTDSLFCSGSSSGLPTPPPANFPLQQFRTFRFIHSPLHHDSEEFDLLRETFYHYNYRECWPAHDYGEGESFIWFLGHVTDSSAGHEMIAGLEAKERLLQRTLPFNTFQATTSANHKDKLVKNLMKFARTSQVFAQPQVTNDYDEYDEIVWGSKSRFDAVNYRSAANLVDSNKFIPRSYFVNDLTTSFINSLQGLFVLKIPDIELGGGIFVVNLNLEEDKQKVLECKNDGNNFFVDEQGNTWGEQKIDSSCVLQKYVTPPFLLRPFPESKLKKFSFGVYTHVTLNPMTVFIHDELLVLFASKGYHTRSHQSDVANVGAEDDLNVEDVLSHLTNGLLNQRLNKDYDALDHVWKGDQLRDALKREGVDYEAVIHPQIREIVATTMAATITKMKAETNAVFEGKSKGAFAYWRHDFLLDESLKVWLLEVDVVPSTGTIGGIDEKLKRRVMHDTLARRGGRQVPAKNGKSEKSKL